MDEKFVDWNTAQPYAQANKMLSMIAEFLASGGSVMAAMEQLDGYQLKARVLLVAALETWGDDDGDPDIFVVSHHHGIRLIRWARARMFFRAVLNWEPPEEELPSYERPMVRVNLYEMAIWN